MIVMMCILMRSPHGALWHDLHLQKDSRLLTGTTYRHAGEHPGVLHKVTVMYKSHLPTLRALTSPSERWKNANIDGWRRPDYLNGREGV